MPVKKRRLSASAASSASSTPAPPSHSIPLAPSQLESTSTSLSALPATTDDNAGLGLAGPGPSTLEQQTAKAVTSGRGHVNASVERREYARLGSKVPGSGDGSEHGEECFLWTDIPVVKIHISWLDRSSFLRVSPSALTISNDRGFRSARANVAVRQGSWYFEVRIENGHGSSGGGRGHLGGGDSGNAHVRIGWGRREASIDAPVGADGYSYAIRDVGGEKVTLSRPKAYANREFTTGDVIGCLINLPPRRDPVDEPKNDPKYIKRQRRHFNYKGQSYFESSEYMPSKEMDAMVDREGKLAAAAAAAAAMEGRNENGHVNGDMSNGNGNGGGGGGTGKKGATTKNTKKGKKEHNNSAKSIPDHIPVARIPPKLEGSSIIFYLNGESLGEAFTDLYDFTPLLPVRSNVGQERGGGKKAHGSHHGDSGADQAGESDANVVHDDGTLGYYPMISCFGNGKAKFNPGPDFEYAPAGYRPTTQGNDGSMKIEADDETTTEERNENGSHRSHIRAMVERWEEFRAEELRYDERDEKEDSEKLRKILEDEERQKQKRGYNAGADGRGGKKKAKVPIKKKKLDAGDEHETTSAASISTPRGDTMTPAPELADSEVGLEDAMSTSFSRRGTTMTPAPEEEMEDVIKVEGSDDGLASAGAGTSELAIGIGASLAADPASSPTSPMIVVRNHEHVAFGGHGEAAEQITYSEGDHGSEGEVEVERAGSEGSSEDIHDGAVALGDEDDEEGVKW
ncbi:hypothetical protein I316_07320 [Kwoniella heveanensis BCC8398]|uniref:B30.2/SPRY domain-containing protein n=1 Tax=Kwoniella heveanensis BCC8398 TaxID=1296120 RepID=A0A1B9GJ33_9TREE|nr:hypothetical protein I316_07320 [Kwoniella heveanensis BCC8398]